MTAEEKYTDLLMQLKNHIDSDDAKDSAVDAGEWEDTYIQLKAIRDWWGIPWDQIEAEVRKTEYPEEWIWKARKDKAFKKYYALRTQLEKMEVLMK